MTSKRIALALPALILANVLVWIWSPYTLAIKSGTYDQLGLLVDVRYEIVEQYVEEPDEEKMVQNAVRGMIEALDDPYTSYFTNEELRGFDKQVRGTFSGIGAEITIDQKEKRLKIVSPLEGMPAWKAGVMAGDIVMEIDGESTKDIKVTDAIDKLTGPEGTKVTLTVRHESGEEAVITITRARIDVPTVKGIRRGDVEGHWDYMLNDQDRIGYIRITQFTDKTAEQVREALEQLKQRDARGVILDVRFNPGGLLESAVEISDMFLDAGKVIVSIKGRAVRERVHQSTSNILMPDTPVVIIANEASASASEIVTGALSDNGRAHFVGTRTFGKGSVQQVKMLDSGQGAIKLTNAYYYLPSGRNIHRKLDDEVWGVDPADGSYVRMTPDEITRMVKLQRAADILRSGNNGESQPAAKQANGETSDADDDITQMAPPPLVPTDVSADWIEKERGDLQLAAALRAMTGFLETNQWPNVGEENATALARETRRDTLKRRRELLVEGIEEIDEQLEKLEAGEDVQLDETVLTDDEGDDAQSELPQGPLNPPHEAPAPEEHPAEIIPDAPPTNGAPQDDEMIEELVPQP